MYVVFLRFLRVFEIQKKEREEEGKRLLVRCSNIFNVVDKKSEHSLFADITVHFYFEYALFTIS